MKRFITFACVIPSVLVLLLGLGFQAYATRDGNGGYSLPSNAFSNPTSGGTLTASDAEAVWNDIEAAIAGSLATDGQSTMTGNLKMGGNKITGLTTGSANTDSVTLGQAQNSGMKWGGVAGGTADALTISLSPVITAYADGQTFYFVSSASPNTGTATLNVNSVGAKTIKKNGAALAAGDIAASKVYGVVYYSNEFHLFSPLPDLAATYARLAVSNTFTAAQTISGTGTGALATLTTTDAGATVGPGLSLYRDSATPAASDAIGYVALDGEDSAGNTQTYGQIQGTITDATSTSEDARVTIQTVTAGTLTDTLKVEGDGISIPSGPVGGTVAFKAHKNGSNQGSMTSTGLIQITFGTEVFDQGGYFSSNAWTPPAGRYRVTATVLWTNANGVDNEVLSVSVLEDAGETCFGQNNRNGTGAQQVTVTCIVDADGNDVYTVYGTKGGAGDGTVDGTATRTWFEGSAL